MKELARGAEAIIYKDNDEVLKERIPKGYRCSEIDDVLRKARTKREGKVIDKLKEFSFVPRLIFTDDKQMTIRMSHIDGKRLADHLEELDWKKLCKEIGEKIGRIHEKNIIHGDLTTSNMILSDEVVFIDFGLSFFSHRIEDRAVDLHLIKEALESKHYTIVEEAFKEVIAGYKTTAKNAKEVFTRLDKVESRGRHKGKH